jgi:hypothetical protein
MTLAQQTERVYRRLHIVRLVAFVDLVLLLALVSAALTGKREIVHILGPLHGINFLILLAIAGTAAIDGVWGWWFPVAILLTAGPPGAFVGEWIIHRRIRGQNAITHDIVSSETTIVETKEKTSTLASPMSSKKERLMDETEEQI